MTSYPPTLTEHAVELVAAGRSLKSVARELDVSSGSVRAWCVAARVWQSPPARKQYPWAIRERAIQLVRAGETRGAVAAELGIGIKAVTRWCKRAGLGVWATPASRAAVIDRVLAGATFREAAEVAGFSPAAVAKWCAAVGVSSPARNKPTGASRRANRTATDAVKRSPLGSAVIVERPDPLELFERDGGLCRLCGGPIDAASQRGQLSFTLDHIVPLELGGLHERSNLRTAHLGCNSAHSVRMRRRLARIPKRQS